MYHSNLKKMVISALAFAISFAPLTANATGIPIYKSKAADLGDAPTTCPTTLGNMNTFLGSGILANYPTVYGDPSCPTGPIHHFPNKMAWLGNIVTEELDAHLMPDIDGMTNINIPANTPDYDGADDGVFHPSSQSALNIPECGTTNFKFVVSRTSGNKPINYRFNAWFDWNNDGDWADAVKCKLSAGTTQNTPERAVTNMTVTLPACTAPVCTTVFITPAFKTARAMTTQHAKLLWMRASLTNVAVAAANKDGSGPDIGYDFGETEDYFLKAQSFNAGVWTFAP